MYIPNIVEFEQKIMDELHKTPYSGLPGYQKMITMIKKYFFWPNMKKEVTEYLAHFLECQQVKVDHPHPPGLLQHYPFQNGSGRQSIWISSPKFPRILDNMIPSWL